MSNNGWVRLTVFICQLLTQTNLEKKEQKNEPLNSSVIDKDVLDDNTPKNIAIYAKALKILKTAKIPFEIGMNGGVYVAPSNRQRADELLEKCTNAWYKYYHSAKYEAS